MHSTGLLPPPCAPDSLECTLQRGIVEWRVRNACHLVAYYRYYRFLPGGTLLYRTSPEVTPPDWLWRL